MAPRNQLPPATPITDNRRDEILLPVVGGLQELIFGSPGLFIDRPGFIANGQPDTALGNAVQDLSRYNCRAWARADKTNYSDAVNQGNADLCGPYLDTLEENPSEGFVGIPFEGGQCEGVQYAVTISTTPYPFSDCSTLGAGVSTNVYVGPIRGLVFRTQNPSGQLCTPGGNAAFLRFGNPVQEVAVGGAGFGVEVEILGIERVDGLPDNCGNPPPVYQPPSTVTGPQLPPSITINLPGVGPVDVTLTLNPEGEPVVCIPELDVCVTVQPPEAMPGGGGEPGPGDPTNGPGDPTAVGDPIAGGEGTPNEDGDIDFGDPPEGRAWVGAFVRLSGGADIGNVAQSEVMQRIYPRVVGNAALRHGSVNGTGQQLRSEWTAMFRANDNLVVDGIRVAVLPSFSYLVYPVSAETCPENTCSTGE